MKSDLATRLAAAVGNGVSVKDADTIIREFLAQIVRCPACDDTGSISVTHKVAVTTPDGAAEPCPYCGGLDTRGRARNDPEWVCWHCYAGDAEAYCRKLKEDPTRIVETHAACGYRIILPLRLPPLRPDN